MSQAYLGSSSRGDRQSGGSRRIPIDTPSGRLEVWTKRVGNNLSFRLLQLLGGPGSTHVPAHSLVSGHGTVPVTGAR